MKQKYIALPLLLVLALTLIMGMDAGQATAQSSNALWFASFWNNPNLEGDPVQTASEGNINHDWGTGPPRSGIQVDGWSARWTAYVDFSPGTYRFTVVNDDGAMIFLGNKHILADWNKHPARTNTVTVSLTGGTYPIAIDYFDDTGPAVLQVSWQWLSGPVAGAADVTVTGSNVAAPIPTPIATGAAWYGEYYNNTTLTGLPVMVRNDAAINFNWSEGSPAPGVIGADNFSVRWTGALNLIPGRYRFALTADDGISLWVNNQLLIDRWYDQQVNTTYAELDWPGGVMSVEVNYYEHGGLAQAGLTWTRLGAAANTGGPAIATVNVSGLNVRVGPGANYERFATMPYGTVVTLLGRNSANTWLFVLLPDGRQGWMFAAYLTISISITDLPIM
jgi:hypothetical protein